DLRQDGSDLKLYRRIIERLRAGESYYDVAGVELRGRGYPSASLFYLRFSISSWLFSLLPRVAWGQGLFCIGALLTLLFAYGVIERDGGKLRAVTAVVLMAGAFLWCIDGDAFLAQELWSGICITISVLAFARGQPTLAIVLGLAALYFRELAL